MKTKVFLAIAIRIIILISIGMMFTFIPDHLRDFFGDVPSDCVGCIGPDRDWDWGPRHYWYFWGLFLLFDLSCINAVMSVINIINKNYDIKNW